MDREGSGQRTRKRICEVTGAIPRHPQLIPLRLRDGCKKGLCLARKSESNAVRLLLLLNNVRVLYLPAEWASVCFFLCVLRAFARDLRFWGSERESVRPPGFIGFPGFWADGLTRFLCPASESSPMFTDPSARSFTDRRRRRKSPVPAYGDDRRGPAHRAAQAQVATQCANSTGCCEASLRGAPGRPNRPEHAAT
jgi:hypothetical protein